MNQSHSFYNSRTLLLYNKVLLLEKEMATHSRILAWKIPQTEDPGGLQSRGSQRAGHDWAHTQCNEHGVSTRQWDFESRIWSPDLHLHGQVTTGRLLNIPESLQEHLEDHREDWGKDTHSWHRALHLRIHRETICLFLPAQRKLKIPGPP